MTIKDDIKSLDRAISKLDEEKPQAKKTPASGLLYRGKHIQKLFPSGYYEIYSDLKSGFLRFDELGDAKAQIDQEIEERTEVSPNSPIPLTSKAKKVSTYEWFGMVRLPRGSRLTVYFKHKVLKSNLTRVQAQKVLEKIHNTTGMNDEDFDRDVSVVARFPGGATMKL